MDLNRYNNVGIKSLFCTSACLIYVFWKKHLEDALANKNSEKLAFKKTPNKNKHAHNYNKKNKTKITRRVWVEKGTSCSMNACACTATCFLIA